VWHGPASPSGPDTVIRKDSFFGCYRAPCGAGSRPARSASAGNVFIGEKTVLDIGTLDGATCRSSATPRPLHSGQRIPVGERWARLPRAAHRPELPEGLGRAPAARSAGSGSARSPWACVFFLYLPLGRGRHVPAADGGADARPGAGPADGTRSPHRSCTSTRCPSRSCCSPARWSSACLAVATVPRPARPVHQAERGSIRCTGSTTGCTGPSCG